MKKANGKVRLCSYFSTGLKEALDSFQNPVPVPEDLYTKPRGRPFFGKLDLVDTHLEVKVDDDSKELR